MICNGDRIVVAVSGGADSVALLHALYSMKDDFDLTLIAAHLNHGIRGEEADQDADFVRDLSARLNVQCVIKKVDVPALKEELKLGIEEIARKVRYEFLEEVASEFNVSKIAVAHNADDQVETVLLNIVRGAGPEGIAGMPAVRGNIIRPLIDVRRPEIEAYLLENGIAWQIDSTNADIEYTRNRVRNNLIPMLEHQYNPRVRESILNLSNLMCDELRVMQNVAESAFNDALLMQSNEKVCLDASKLRKMDKALIRRCIRLAVGDVKGDLRNIEFVQVERIVEGITNSHDFDFTLPPGDVYAQQKDGEVCIFKRSEHLQIDFELELIIPGKTDVPELGISVNASFVSPDERPKTNTQAIMDFSKVKGKLVVRTWRDGDRIVPFGMGGHKKLQDLFTDQKVPVELRGRVPVIVDDEKIVWVAGVRVSELTRVNDDTTQALLLEISPPI